MARHMKAASCRLLRSHAAVDGTPHRLMVPHRAPRPSAALPRQQEANSCQRSHSARQSAEISKSLRNTVFAPAGNTGRPETLKLEKVAHSRW